VGVISAAERDNAKNYRLNALENDDAAGDGVVGDSDEEFVIQNSDDGEPLVECTMKFVLTIVLICSSLIKVAAVELHALHLLVTA